MFLSVFRLELSSSVIFVSGVRNFYPLPLENVKKFLTIIFPRISPVVPVNMQDFFKRFPQDFLWNFPGLSIRVFSESATDDRPKHPIWRFLGISPNISLANSLKNFIGDFFQRIFVISGLPAGVFPGIYHVAIARISFTDCRRFPRICFFTEIRYRFLLMVFPRILQEFLQFSNSFSWFF